MQAIYLDYNATTPIDPRVAEACSRSSVNILGTHRASHVFGLEARRLSENSRTQGGESLGSRSEEIVFTVEDQRPTTMP